MKITCIIKTNLLNYEDFKVQHLVRKWLTIAYKINDSEQNLVSYKPLILLNEVKKYILWFSQFLKSLQIPKNQRKFKNNFEMIN